MHAFNLTHNYKFETLPVKIKLSLLEHEYSGHRAWWLSHIKQIKFWCSIFLWHNKCGLGLRRGRDRIKFYKSHPFPSALYSFMCPNDNSSMTKPRNCNRMNVLEDPILSLSDLSSVSGPKIWLFGNASGLFWFFHPAALGSGPGSGSGEHYAANNNVWRCVYWVQWSTIPCLVLALFTGPGGGGGGAKYQISGDEKCQNPFAGNLATLPHCQARDQTLGGKHRRAGQALSQAGLINLSRLMQYFAMPWSMAHLTPPIIEPCQENTEHDFYDLLVRMIHSAL